MLAVALHFSAFPLVFRGNGINDRVKSPQNYK
jgi:hypothetical protein